LSGLLAVSLRGLAFLGKVLLLLALVGGTGFGLYRAYVWVLSTDYLGVKRIEVLSARRAPVGEIQRLVHSVRGRNILSIDLDEVEQAVAGHPWVIDARAERKLPDTVRIEVTEHRERALLLMGHLYLVNDRGQVFKRADPEDQEGMPVITGISRLTYLNDQATAERQIRKALDAIDRYRSRMRPALSEINVSPRGAITLYHRRGGLAVRVGKELTEARLRKMDAVWAALGPDVSRARVLFLDNEARTDRVTVRMGSYQ
jgi:cell division protein FtsQ